MSDTIIAGSPVAYTANVAGVPVNIDFDTLPIESRVFVIEYGLKQYIADGAAVSKEFQSGERKGEKKTADEIAAEKTEGVQERIENLMSGEFTRRGPGAAKLTPEERERDSIIMAQLAAWAKARNSKLPTKTGKKADPELLEKLVAKWYEKNQTAIDKEVARRMKDAAKVQDMTDMDELLG